MKILYDHQIFSFQKFGGISRYFAQIIKEISSIMEVEVAIKYSDNIYLNQLNINTENTFNPYNPIDKFLCGKNFKGKRRIFKLSKNYTEENYIDSDLLNKKNSIEILKRQDYDVFHPTSYDNYFLPYLLGKPFVITIHDMIYEIYSEFFNDYEAIKRKAILAHKADHIIAVSENTKKDIVDILRIPEKKISVVYHASSLTDNKNKIVDLPSNYLLFIGDRWFYKNFFVVVRAVEPIMKNDNTLMVICTGREFSENELAIFEFLNIKDRFINVQVNDADLYQYYNNAKALVFPSYYEGFGMAILEAFQAGCPVILGNSRSSLEIAGDAALYFEPKNILQLRQIIEEILNNDELRDKYSIKGSKRLSNFSWKNSALKTISVYKSVLFE